MRKWYTIILKRRVMHEYARAFAFFVEGLRSEFLIGHTQNIKMSIHG